MQLQEHFFLGNSFYLCHLLEIVIVSGEEANFLKNYQTPMEQIRPEHTIICLAHSKNTISKKRFFKDDRLVGTLDEKKITR